MQKENKRVDWIDFGKGFTIFLVLLGHVLRGLYLSNRYSEDIEKTFQIAIQLLYVFHIPVFFALSGYLFNSISNWRELWLFWKKKSIALLVPFLFFNISTIVLEQLVGQSIEDPLSFSTIFDIWQKPITVSWFLYILWGIFLLISFLSLFIKNKTSLLLITVFLSLWANTFPSDIYLLQRTLIWSSSFVFGFWLREIRLDDRVKSILSYSFSSLFVICFTCWIILGNYERIDYSVPKLQFIFVPISILLAFINYPKLSGFIFEYFSKKGSDSLGIYIFHAQVLAIIRTILFKLGILSIPIHLIFEIMFGWLLTLLVLTISKKIRLLDFFLTPLKYLSIK